MFVRFRKLPCGGFRPGAASYEAAHIACRRSYGFLCRGHCHAKPRCRWVIGTDEKLSPYRLKVVLVENRRVNGKVKQETLAVLGSIDATWLPEFWDGIEPGAVAKLKADDWELQSLRARAHFWRKANQRLKQLANRLGPDKKRIRMAAHARVPWPMKSEREKLELLEAKDDFDFVKHQFETSQRMVSARKNAIKTAQEGLAEEERLARKWTFLGAEAGSKLAKLSARRGK